MRSKLYKTHRKPSYYRLRRWGYFSLSLMIATVLVVVPLTLAQASNQVSTSSSQTTSDSSSTSSSTSSETTIESSQEESIATMQRR